VDRFFSRQLPGFFTDTMKAFFQAAPLLITLSLCFGYLCYASSAGAPEPQDKGPSPALSVAQLTRAKQLFKERCVRCHGADGRGQTVIGGMLEVPDFTDKAWWKDDVENERLIESVRNGKGAMPKFGKKLTSQQIALLVTYLRRFDKSSR
jgi:mono/diheme cytochrome c family protein